MAGADPGILDLRGSEHSSYTPLRISTEEKFGCNGKSGQRDYDNKDKTCFKSHEKHEY